MLSLQGATVRFGGRAVLDAVDLEVAEHEVVCVLGPSGSGKSTLLRAVAGLQPLDAGRVSLAGRDQGGVPAHQRGVGLMFQDHQLFPQRDVGANVAFGLRMHGPFGLAAGFDKNAVAIDGMSMLGFDHVEIGTVTGEPQPGNPRKRLFRLVADRALINRMGFNNDGSLAVAARLATREPVFRTVVGVNIGKTKVVPEAEAVADYVKSAERLAPYADYLVVNVSSPNTPGLRNLQAVDHLRPLLTAGREAADRVVANRRVPLLVKIAPDLADEDVDAVADLAVELGLDGIIATNTTIARPPAEDERLKSIYAETGGLSGKPLRARSTEVVRHLYKQTRGGLPIIGVGGIIGFIVIGMYMPIFQIANVIQ